MLDAIRDVQIPLLAAMLLGGCAAKLARTLRAGAVDAGLGPTALFPMRMRRPLGIAICLAEGLLGLGLIITAGRIGHGAAATWIRVGSFVLFVVATSALIELRQNRPDAGCGCFGDFSTAPVSGRSLARSVFLAVAALATIGLPPIEPPRSAGAAVELIVILFAELFVLGLLSPEIGEGLIRLGYAEPCELRIYTATRAEAVLHRSKSWRRYSALLTADIPADSWRELCWRYLAYPAADQEGRPAEVVFAVSLQYRRPAVRAALVDAATGTGLPWPQTVPAGRRRVAGGTNQGAKGPAAATEVRSDDAAAAGSAAIARSATPLVTAPLAGQPAIVGGGSSAQSGLPLSTGL